MNESSGILDIDQRQQRYLEIRAVAEWSAGPNESLRFRAGGYLDIYQASDGTCKFGLVAAHGALWASWYLIFAKVAALGFCVLDVKNPGSPRKKYKGFSAYVDALKEINKLVMVETYVLVHTIRELGPDFAIAKDVPADLAHDYADAMARGETADIVLRDIYHRHFLWEQERVESTKLDDAFAVFEWEFMRNICQRPWVWFSYFRAGKSMNFKSFTDQAERVDKGLIAFDRAVDFGVDRLASITRKRLRIFPGMFVWKTHVRKFVTVQIMRKNLREGA